MSRFALAVQKFLLFKELRYAVGLLRYVYFRYVRQNIDVYGGDQAHLGRRTLDHNFANIRRSLLRHDRVFHLIWPLLAVEYVASNRREMKTLSVGPRSEGELLLIAAHGFKWRNIKGVDLFSYTPRIDVADMHELPYSDSSFDIVFSGWTLGYSDDRARALSEMVRVLRPGGFVAFGQGFSSEPTELTTKAWAGTKDRHNPLDSIFAPIADNIDRFYFRHEITPEMADRGERAILAVFSIKKTSNHPEMASQE